jgi:integrase
MPRVTLTDRFVAGAKPASGDRQTYFFDSKTAGLALRVSDTGHRGWTLQFTPPGEERRARLTLGSYPAMPLAAARTKAEQARHELQDGIDPRTSLKNGGTGTAAMTFKQLVDRYVADPDKAQLRSLREISRRLRVNALPILGHIRLDQLTRRDVKDVTNRILRRGARTQAWHTHKDLHAVLAWGVKEDFLTANPIAGVGAPGGYKAGERNLSDDEIRALWAVLPTALAKSKTCQRIIQLALITGQRLGEISGMARDELDLKRRIWVIPGARSKNKHAHEVPLSEMAVHVIQAALADAGKSAYVFPDESGGPLASPVVTRAILRAHETDDDRPLGRFGVAAWSAHDLRRTMLTGLAKIGVVPHVIAHVANHRSLTKSGVTFAHYVQHSYENEKRQALDLWADRLQAIIDGAGARVVPLRRGKPQ